MAICTTPKKMYLDPDGVLSPNPIHNKFGYPDQLVPCRRCIACRMNSASDWTTRILCEQKMHEHSCFITLTYAPEHLPPHGNLEKKDFQVFIKSLRKRTGLKLRYYMCGEYGSAEYTNRPHFHAVIFGYDFPDKVISRFERGARNYFSKLLNKTWGKGRCEVADLNHKNAAYTARYIMKKQYGDDADIEYGVHYDINTKQKLFNKQPEYTNMSLRPGIGQTFYDAYWGNIFPDDQIFLNGSFRPAPKFFREQLKKTHPKMFELLKQQRIEKAESVPNKTKVLKSKQLLERVKRLKRQL